MLRLRQLQWAPKPGASHILVALLGSGRRVASIFFENANPLKARGSPPLQRPYTLELYVPLPKGTDKVQKFTELEAAKTAAGKQLERFVSDALGRDDEDTGVGR